MPWYIDDLLLVNSYEMGNVLQQVLLLVLLELMLMVDYIYIY
jgi:hypothetical protein